MAENLGAKFSIDVSDLKRGLATANKLIRESESEFKAAAAGMNDWRTSADGLNARIKSLTQISDAQRAKVEALKKQYSDLVAGGLDPASDRAITLRTNINNATAAFNQTQVELEQTTNALNDLSDGSEEAADSLDNVNNAGDGFTVLKGALSNLISNFIQSAVDKTKELASAVIDTGKTFDSSMSNVGAISGATAEDMDKLRAKAEEMGAKTKFSASEAADAMGYMAMAGWKTGDMLNGIEGIMNLAAASGADLATTSDIVTDALTAMGYSAGDAGRLADVMAAASSNANTNVELMGETFKYAASVAGSYGYSMEDVAVQTGLMANAGIKGSEAGTALRSIMTRLATDAGASSKSLGALGTLTEKLGVDFYNAEGEMRPLNQVISQTREAWKKLTAEEQANYGKKIAGQEALAGWSALMNAAPADIEKLERATYGAGLSLESFTDQAKKGGVPIDDFKKQMEKAGISADDFTFALQYASGDAQDFVDTLSEISSGTPHVEDVMTNLGISVKDLQTAMDNSTGTAERMAGVMQDNLGGDLTTLQSQLEGVSITLYDEVSPYLREAVAGFKKFVGAVDWSKVGATIGGLFNAAKTGLKWVGDNLPTVGAVVGGILAAITAQTIANKVATISAAAAEKGLTIAQYAAAAAQKALNGAMAANPIGLIVLAITALVAAFVYLWNNCDAFRQFWIDLWEKIKPVAVDAMQAVAAGFSAAWDAIKTVWDVVQPYFAAIWDAIKTIFSVVATVLGGFFSAAWAEIKPVWDVVQPYFANIWSAIKTIFSVVATVLGGFFSAAWTAIKFVWSVATSFFSTIWENIKIIFSVVATVLGGFFSVAWTAITVVWNAAKGFFSGIWTGIKNVFSPVVNFFRKAFSDAWNAIKKVFDPVGKFFSGIWDTIKKVFTNIGQKIGDAMGGAFKFAINAVLATAEKVLNVPINAINGLLDVINKVPGVSLPKLKTFTLPRLAKGGVFDHARAAIFGEDGAEAVVPLERNRQWIKAVADEFRRQQGDSGINGSNKNVTIQQTNYYSREHSRYELYRSKKDTEAAVKLALMGV